MFHPWPALSVTTTMRTRLIAWSRILMWCRFRSVVLVESASTYGFSLIFYSDIALGNIQSSGCSRLNKILNGVFQCTLWFIWKWRNRIVNASPDLVSSIKDDIFAAVQRVSKILISAHLKSAVANLEALEPFDLFFGFLVFLSCIWSWCSFLFGFVSSWLLLYSVLAFLLPCFNAIYSSLTKDDQKDEHQPNTNRNTMKIIYYLKI